jgi:NTP pyrophosphatase (non-canonical NTP hydrolase)
LTLHFEEPDTDIMIGIDQLVDLCYNNSNKAGWWTNTETGEPIELTVELFLAKLALIHSEVSEALEGYRKGLQDDHLPHRPMAEVELADAVIRICDLAGRAGYDLSGAILEKIEYNTNREDHKLENRMKDGGKKA